MFGYGLSSISAMSCSSRSKVNEVQLDVRIPAVFNLSNVV